MVIKDKVNCIYDDSVTSQDDGALGTIYLFLVEFKS